ncbi:MAG: hypothetical protein ACUVTL_09160 [Thermoproteota archaeon]
MLPAFYLRGVAGTDGAKLSTDRTEYRVGETVIFSGTGYSPSGSIYEIRIYHAGFLVGEIEFESVEIDSIYAIPDDITWTIPFDAESGTYTAEAYAVIDLNTPLASTTFDVLSAKESLTSMIEKLEELENFVEESVETKDFLLSSLSNSIMKVEAAIELYDEGKNHTAANQLRASRNMLIAFIHKILAQSGKGIEYETASQLIEEANASILMIDSLIGSTLIPLGKQLALNVQSTLAKQERHLNRFMIRTRLGQEETDDDIISFANHTEREMVETLARLRERNGIIERCFENGSIDYQELMMELYKGNEAASSVKEIAELLLDELTTLNGTRPGLGKHLGQFIQIAKAIKTNSTDTVKDMEESISRAKSHGHDGQGQNKGNDGEKGKGHDKDVGNKGKDDDKNGGKGKGNDKGNGHSKK